MLNKKESKVICKREFEIILLQTQSLSIKPFKRQFSFIKNTSDFKTFWEAFVVEFYLKLRLILRIITYLTQRFQPSRFDREAPDFLANLPISRFIFKPPDFTNEKKKCYFF